MKPLIGIVSRVEAPGDTERLVVNDIYRRAIVKAGGIPLLILPPQDLDYGTIKNSEMKNLNKTEKEMLLEQLKLCDGILMPGGFKILNYDFYVLEYAMKEDIPILGICLGMQTMANYKKKIELLKIDEARPHNNIDHEVIIDKNSRLYQITKKRRQNVLSRHNYEVVEPIYYDIVAYAKDGTIEAIERKDKTFNIGVQWHPEEKYDESIETRRLFKEFILCSKNSGQK